MFLVPAINFVLPINSAIIIGFVVLTAVSLKMAEDSHLNVIIFHIFPVYNGLY